ncbi:DUF7504 family protein [Haladaptatus caseinilyticus]|uniref:DUF7504 family protein n=1 Tax=Haladaptatus caseinilyticus TaxID=2993314 RepID=UPI00224B22DB|nr:HalOD1 output domain-containing protein [Haladaptatus caseinilyticus]
MKSTADPTPSARNVLLFCPAVDDETDTKRLSRRSPIDPTTCNALFLSYERPPEELLERWQSHVGEKPAEFGAIAVGKYSSSPQAEVLRSDTDRNIVSIANPERLGRLQTAVYLFLDQWSANDQQSMLYFDSITAMLRYVNRTTAFRFLHSLTDSLRRLGVTAHFYMNPDVHDEETLAIFRPLFDTVVGDQTKPERAVSPDVLSTLFTSSRRRSVCRYLVEVADRATVATVAERIAEWEVEGTPSSEMRERVHITLRHVHLPKLVEAGVVELDGETVSAAEDSIDLERYNRIVNGGDPVRKTEPTMSDTAALPTTNVPNDQSSETYWTVYGTARDSVVVMLARALGAVLDVHPTELRPVLSDIIDIDALQRLDEREETSVYAMFNYGEYEVVVDGGQIRLYESS